MCQSFAFDPGESVLRAMAFKEKEDEAGLLAGAFAVDPSGPLASPCPVVA